MIMTAWRSSRNLVSQREGRKKVWLFVFFFSAGLEGGFSNSFMIMPAWRSSRNLVSQREGRTMKPFWMTLFLSVTFVILPQAVAHDRDNAMRIVRLETNSDQGGRPDYHRPYAGDYPRVKVDRKSVV